LKRRWVHTATEILEELLNNLHVARDLLTTHLLDAVVAVVDAEDLLAAKDGNADDEDVLADEHVPAVELATHGELAATHMRHEKYS
jgi:hypothetical protein